MFCLCTERASTAMRGSQLPGNDIASLEATLFEADVIRGSRYSRLTLFEIHVIRSSRYLRPRYSKLTLFEAHVI